MTPDPKTIIATKMIEFDSRAYERFYDGAWANRELAKVSGTDLTDPFEELCLMWKSASNSHYLPLLFARSLSDFTNDFVNGFQPYGPKFFDALGTGLLSKMEGDLSVTKQHKIRQFLEEVGKKLAEHEPLPEISVPAWWDRVKKHAEFQLVMSAAPGMAYCTVFFAYDCFIDACYKLLRLNPKFWTGNRDFWVELEKVITDAKLRFWTDDYVAMAREARNSIAHRGGKAKQELLDAVAKISVDVEKIHIGPNNEVNVQASDCHILSNKLKEKITQLIDDVLPKI